MHRTVCCELSSAGMQKQECTGSIRSCGPAKPEKGNVRFADSLGGRMPAVAGGRKILIVDDEPTIADTLALIFAASGYEAKTAYSAEQALEMLEDWRPDLAVIDVVLPGMNGIEFAIFLKASYTGCQFLLFSGQPGTSGLLEEARKKGHLFEILAKPLHPTFMLATVSDMLTPCQDPPKPNLMH